MEPSKNEKIYDGITDVREDIVNYAQTLEGKKKRKPWWPAAVAAVLVAALVSAVVLWPRGNPLTTSAYALAEAQYPEMAPYPNEEDYINADGSLDDSYSDAYDAWWESSRLFLSHQYPELAQFPDREDYLNADGGLDESYLDALDAYYESEQAFFSNLDWPNSLTGFLDAATEEFLTGAGTDNRVYSPLNIYMALAMLAETTGGDSREQILDLLGADSIETLRTQAAALWRTNYQNDGRTASILASSLWLNQDIRYQQPTLDTLAETYYASSFQGEMGSEEYNQALRDWLNEQTGGLLADQAQGLEMDADTILAIAATLYFKAQWSEQFSAQNTTPDTFHAVSGDVTCDFMHQTTDTTYYWGDNFSAISLSLAGSGSMWFLLPDEGVSVDQLLESGETMDFLLLRPSDGESASVWSFQKFLTVNLSLPKFDVSSDLNLVDGLQNLGVTDVFNDAVSDFTPLTDQTDEIYVSQARHAARVAIDEEGCTAAAFTVMMGPSGDMPPDDEIDFVLDRPFLFAITNQNGLPLFLGVVNQLV